MKKPYEGHEIAYQRMKKKSIRCWEERAGVKVATRKRNEGDLRRILNDILAQPWAPKSGKAIELGCGTGPILRWICKRGFIGLGVDVSKTAIAMARQQSKGLNIKFRQTDICSFAEAKAGKFDLAVDGHCLHCIIQPEDRKAFFRNTFRLLKKNGLFIVMTMCTPANRKFFLKMCRGQKLIGHTIYVPYEKARAYEGFRTISGCDYMPARKVLHWKSILSEIRQAGFQVKLLRYAEAADAPFGSLSVAALA